jgi:hypothetical protein
MLFWCNSWKGFLGSINIPGRYIYDEKVLKHDTKYGNMVTRQWKYCAKPQKSAFYFLTH